MVMVQVVVVVVVATMAGRVCSGDSVMVVMVSFVLGGGGNGYGGGCGDGGSRGGGGGDGGGGDGREGVRGSVAMSRTRLGAEWSVCLAHEYFVGGAWLVWCSAQALAAGAGAGAG